MPVILSPICDTPTSWKEELPAIKIHAQTATNFTHANICIKRIEKENFSSEALVLESDTPSPSDLLVDNLLPGPSLSFCCSFAIFTTLIVQIASSRHANDIKYSLAEGNGSLNVE